MKWIRQSHLWAGLWFGCLVLAHGEVPGTKDLLTYHRAATNSLKAYQTQITSSNYRLLGFQSTGEVYQVVTGEPFLKFCINKDRLAAYTTNLGTARLVTPTNQLIVPLMNGTSAVSSMTLRLTGGAWTNGHWGDPQLIRALTALRRSRQGTPLVAVELTSLSMWFAGVTNAAGQLELIPLYDDSKSVPPLKVNTALRPQDLERLSKRAKPNP